MLFTKNSPGHLAENVMHFARVLRNAGMPVGSDRVHTALAALHLYQPERHYVVRDGTVQIVDETTGRIAEGRVWSNGLQQLVEVKEGCAPTPTMQTQAQITFQRFFPRYLRLGGLSGTLRDARGAHALCTR